MTVGNSPRGSIPQFADTTYAVDYMGFILCFALAHDWDTTEKQYTQSYVEIKWKVETGNTKRSFVFYTTFDIIRASKNVIKIFKIIKRILQCTNYFHIVLPSRKTNPQNSVQALLL